VRESRGHPHSSHAPEITRWPLLLVTFIQDIRDVKSKLSLVTSQTRRKAGFCFSLFPCMWSRSLLPRHNRCQPLGQRLVNACPFRTGSRCCPIAVTASRSPRAESQAPRSRHTAPSQRADTPPIPIASLARSKPQSFLCRHLYHHPSPPAS